MRFETKLALWMAAGALAGGGAGALAGCGEDPPDGALDRALERGEETLRETFRERPPEPTGVRMAPDWAEWIPPLGAVTVPDEVCGGGRPSDVDVRERDRPRVEERPRQLGRGGDPYWRSRDGVALAGYVRVNREFTSFTGRALAAYVWCG